MTISQSGLNQIKRHEGLRLAAYYDQVGKPTIGYGNTFYENGRPVRMGDKISMERAESLLRFMVDTNFAPKVEAMVTSALNQNQFDALVSFAYNAGAGDMTTKKGGLIGSTLLKKVNKNPFDQTIREEFLKWNKGRIGGKLTIIPGLSRRRVEEADLYFKPVQ